MSEPQGRARGTSRAALWLTTERLARIGAITGTLSLILGR